MPLAKDIQHRVIENTSLPYRSYLDITSNEPNFVDGLNVLTSAKQIAERRAGFSDYLESIPTTFNNIQREFRWSKWNGTQFYSMVSAVVGGVAKVYALQIGVDVSYVLLFTSTSSTAFSFVVSNNTLFYGNGTDMRAWSGSGADRKWGITKPSAAPLFVVGGGAGIVAYAGGYYYRVTYGNSITGHESSSSVLSLCTGNFSANQVQLTLVASADSQVDQIRVYRTTDGGSTDPALMQEISNSPFPNVNNTVNDTTPDGSLSTRTCTGTSLNDPPTPCTNLCWYGGRIFGSSGATTYFSGAEELGNGVPEECWPSGLGGNFFPWDNAITAHAPMTDGVAVFTRGRIWKIEGDRRDNFRRYKLLDKRGTISQNNVAIVGNTIAWFDVSGQMWMADSDLGEIGFDIRTDLAAIDQTRSFIAIHIAGKSHWILVLDSVRGKLFVYDLDTKNWMPPWQVSVSSAALNSAETSAGNVKLTLAYSGQNIVAQNPLNYVDLTLPYTAFATLNLLDVHPANNAGLLGVVDYLEVETDAQVNTDVSILLDDDPQTASYTSIQANVQDPPMRVNGTNLKVKRYNASTDIPGCQRASFKLTWDTVGANFRLYTIDMGWHSMPNG